MKPHQLPEPDVLKKRWQSFAMLDAILSPEWELRYFSFDAHWSSGETLGSMRDGQGSTMRCLFTEFGVVLSGFDIDHKKAAFALKASDLPKAFAAFAAEPAFESDKTSFCFYQEASAKNWTVAGPHAENSHEALTVLLAMDAKAYTAWAREYYELMVDLDVVRRIFDREPLTPEIVHVLNPNAAMRDVKKDAKEISYSVMR